MFVFLKLPPAACTIPGYEVNLRQCHDSSYKHMETSIKSFATNTSRHVGDSYHHMNTRL